MHIDNLPKELKELVLLRRKQEKRRNIFFSDTDVISMFEWTNTPEGQKFWKDVDSGRNIKSHNEYAKSVLAGFLANYEIY